MSYHHSHSYPPGEDDDVPSSNRPAPSRGQNFHSIGPFSSSPMPAAIYTSPINNPPANINREPDTSRDCYGSYGPAPVTVRQQQHGGQPPLQPSLEPPITFWDLRPHDGIQQNPSDAQGDWWIRDPLPPQLGAGYTPYAQGEMPEGRRNQAGSSMLPANMPYSGYRNMYNARQDDASTTYNSLGNANDRIGDVYSSTGDSSSQLEPLESPVILFDANANATMNTSNTAPPGNHWNPITGELSQVTNATLQTPRVGSGYGPSRAPTYDTHTFAQPSEAFTPTYPDHRPLQPRHPNVIDPQLPASWRARLRDSARSNVAPPPRRTRRRRSQSSSPLRRSRPRKGRILNTPSDYKRKRTAYVKRYNLACDRCKTRKIECTHWDEAPFRSWYEASHASNTPTSHATAPEIGRAFRRPRPPAGTRALAPSQRFETTQTSSSPTLLAHPGQTDWWEHTLAQNGKQLEVLARLSSPVSAAAVLQGYRQHQDLANLDTMTHAASDFTHDPVRPMQSPFTEGETPSQETAVMQTGTHFGPHTNSEQQFPTSNLLSELDEVNEPQQYPSIPNHDFTLLSPPEDDWDPSPPS